VRAAIAAAIALLLVYWETLESYLLDQYYQEHFLYLWVFLGLALTRTLRGPFGTHFALNSARSRVGFGLAIAAILLLGASESVGSSTGTRASLAVFLTALAVLVVPGWPLTRCLAHGLLLLLCFGLPYAVWYPITSHLQWGVAQVIALPSHLGIANYTVRGAIVDFPHYDLAITADCSGLGQLLTFSGIAGLAILSSARNRRRAATLMLLAVVLAWLSNLARVSAFVFFVGIGWTTAVDDPTWHALLGFGVFLPFVTVLVWLALRTHRPLPPPVAMPSAARGRWPVFGILVLLALVHFACRRPDDVDFPAPAWFAELAAPPDHRLLRHASSEASDRLAYGTRWLHNARYESTQGHQFDLFHYTTRSRSHLCVHKVAACVARPGLQIRYAAPVEVAGQTWWPIALDSERELESMHVYYAFEVGGQRFDDSSATQLHVFQQRLLGKTWEVRLTRATFPGRLPAAPHAHAAAILGWLGKLTKSSG